MDGSELLAAICAAPDDDVPRLVYADWVARHDDALAEFIALHVRLARADADDVLLPERGRIESRMRALRKKHHERWVAPLCAIAKAEYTFRRGFVEHMCMYADRNLGFIAGQLFAHAPLLRAVHVDATQLHGVIMNEASARFEELTFEEPSLDTQMLARLRERLEDGAVRSLDIEKPYIADRTTHDTLATWPLDVEHFGISAAGRKGIELRAAFVERFMAAPHRERLRSLRFEKLDLSLIDELPVLRGVERLVLNGCKLFRQHGRLLRFANALPALASLAVSGDEISREEMEDVVAACPQLRHLTLDCLSTLDPLVPLASQVTRLRLRSLEDGDLKPLFDHDWPKLVELRVGRRYLSDRMHASLCERFPAAVHSPLKRSDPGEA